MTVQQKSRENIQLGLGQKWLNTYCGSIPNYIQVPESGDYDTTTQTIIGVLTALQKNIGVSIDAISKEYLINSHVFGKGTRSAIGYPALGITTSFANTSNLNMLKILQIGLWCKGIDPGDFGVCSEATIAGINELRARAGAEQNGLATRMIFEAISTEIAFELTSSLGGINRVREIQQMINGGYAEERQILVPCDGVKERTTIAGFMYYYQRKIGLTESEAKAAKGLFNEQTYDLSKIISPESFEPELLKILQDGLYLNNGYDVPQNNVFNNATEIAVKSLQASMGILITGIVDRITWGFVLESCGYQGVKPTVCDTSKYLEQSDINTLKENGITMVGRYLTARYKMTPEEAQRIIAANIAIIPLFEYGVDPSYFTFEQGVEDAKQTAHAARVLGIPDDGSVTIYFSADNDFTIDQANTILTDYFNGVQSKMIGANLGYQVGVYGGRELCTILINKRFASSAYVSASSYEYFANMGYKMPARWGFNQYATLTSEGKTIFLGDIPIDKVASSGYDKGATILTKNGVTKSVSRKDIKTSENETYLNEKHADTLNEIAENIINKVLNIKTPNIYDYTNTKRRQEILGWRLPLGKNMYLRVDYGLKEQSGTGSSGTLYFNKNDDSWMPEITADCFLPKGFLGGNIGSNINIKMFKTGKFSKIFKSLIPTYTLSTKTYDWDGTDVSGGIQIYGCWDSNRGAKEGYWEIGAEFGANVGGGKLIGIPSTFYFYFDIIIGINDEVLDKVFEKIDTKIESTFESVTDYITKTVKSIIDGNPEIEENDGDEELEFDDGTPEMFEAVDAIEVAETTEEVVTTWEALLEVLEILGVIALCG